VIDSRGTFASVSEAEIRAARRDVEDCEGLSPCFAAAAAVAGLIKIARAGGIRRNAVVVVNLTGGDRPDEDARRSIRWISKTGEGWSVPPPQDL
jgi:threonine synthase